MSAANDSEKSSYSSLFGIWLRRFGETHVGTWLMDVFQAASAASSSGGQQQQQQPQQQQQSTAEMASAQSLSQPSPAATSSGPLSFMGCMREASPPPTYDDQPHHYHHHLQQQHYQQTRPQGLPTGEFATLPHGYEAVPKEPKKRRSFHPLRGLRRIFRKKSRGAADSRATENEANGEHGGALAMRHDREEITLRDPAGRVEEIRSRSASELLTDSCDRDRLFLRRRGLEESFAKLQRGSGQLSVSHDSVFPGEVGDGRPLSSLDLQASSLERRTAKASNHEIEQQQQQQQHHKEPPQKHRISLRVLEQIKTAIESRNQIAATTTTTTTTETTNSLHNRFSSRDKSNSSTAAQANATEDTQAKVPRKDAPTPNGTDSSPGSPLNEDLPEPTTAGQLSHTAALHRISVRPKNRRPPRRSTSNGTISNNGLPRIDSISENSIDTLDSLEGADSGLVVDSPPSTPQQEASKPIPILRKSSSRLSRNSEVFEELEAKLPILRRAAASAAAVSPDSLESNLDSRSVGDALDAAVVAEDLAKAPLPKPSPRTASLGSDGYEKSPRRRSSSNRLSKSPDSLESSSPGWFTKSTEAFDKLSDFEREESAAQSPVAGKPVPAKRQSINPISKSQERVYSYSKSSDSLEALEALNSDDSMERRRSSFEIRPRRHPVHKIMSKSTECFDSTLHEHQTLVLEPEDKPKRASLSEINLSRGSAPSSRHAKLLLMSKSSESFDKIASLAERNNLETEDNSSNNCWRANRRTAHSSESSDNLDLDDNCKLENRNRARRSTPKRLSAASFADEQDNVIARKPEGRRLQKSSESSELGSTDTLDSERRNTIKSSDSDETLDSLEKDLQEQNQSEQDRKDEETTESILEKREKSNDDLEDEKVGSYWRRRTNSQESKDSNNLDIHQLMAYTLVPRVQENGNNDNVQENNQHDEEKTSPKTISAPSVVYPKKKLHQQQMQQQQLLHQQLQQQQQQQQQSSSEENKTLSSSINNILSSKTDEDLQNMLNGNISEVSTDTKSFKEKLIMFEKLGK